MVFFRDLNCKFGCGLLPQDRFELLAPLGIDHAIHRLDDMVATAFLGPVVNAFVDRLVGGDPY